jgi:hypothetical protein
MILCLALHHHARSKHDTRKSSEIMCVSHSFGLRQLVLANAQRSGSD